jgi:hypothetical protein
LKPPRFSFATTQGVQIFGSVASSRSRLPGTMRESRQSRCSAAYSTFASANRLGASPNSAWEVFGSRPPRQAAAAAGIADGTGFKQGLPDA